MDTFRTPLRPPPPQGVRTLRGVLFLKVRTSDSRQLERKTHKLTFLRKLREVVKKTRIFYGQADRKASFPLDHGFQENYILACRLSG